MVSPVKNNSHLHITLPASLEEIDNVLRQTMLFLKNSSIKDNFFTYNYIIREALNNAVIHGSLHDTAKTITFDLNISKTGVDICVEDEGEGFDWQPLVLKALVPTAETHGRGIFCMSKLHFATSYNPKGNILYLHKDLNKNQIAGEKS